jgi:hypothetical protein
MIIVNVSSLFRNCTKYQLFFMVSRRINSVYEMKNYVRRGITHPDAEKIRINASLYLRMLIPLIIIISWHERCEMWSARSGCRVGKLLAAHIAE